MQHATAGASHREDIQVWEEGTIFRGQQDRQGVLVRLLLRARPIRILPVWIRYLITTGFVLICFATRLMLEGIYPFPFLIFLPAVVLASFVFNRGSGFFATFLSGILAFYFFVEPKGAFGLSDLGTLMSIGLYLLVGALIASIIEALRITAEELAMANSELQLGRRELRAGLNQLEAIVEGAPDPIFLKDTEGRYVHVNNAMAAVLGAPKRVIIGRTDRDFLSEPSASRIEATERQVLERREMVSCEDQVSAGGREPRWYWARKTPWYGPDGELAGVAGVARDIHKRKLAEQALREGDQQKAVLLKDVEHRVKNHLQSLHALMALSVRQCGSEEARREIETALGRLAVFNRLYERMRLSHEEGATVNAGEYLRSIATDVAAAVVGQRPISVGFDLSDVEVDANRAVTLGLIVNEAITNALKHAFPGERPGSVEVRLSEDGAQLKLEVGDDGIGLSAAPRSQGTGYHIIQSMARQLGGRLEIEGSSGTRVLVVFPKVASGGA